MDHDLLLARRLSYAAEDDKCKKPTCEEVQYYFLKQKQTCLNLDIIERLKQRGIKVLRVDNEREREQERKGEIEEGKEGKEPKKQGKEPRVSEHSTPQRKVKRRRNKDKKRTKKK